MNLPKPFDRFVFNHRLEKTLRHFVENPADLPMVTCFYGYAGLGKTSFAKEYSSRFAYHTDYHAMNEKGSGNFSEAFKKSLYMNRRAMSLYDAVRGAEDGKPFESITILDEFHNIPPSKQDYFKTVFDNLRERDRVIICLNTKGNKPVDAFLTEPIWSRSHCIDFNTMNMDAKDYVDRLLTRFDALHRHEIHSYLPDIRRIERENDLRKKMEALI